MSKKVKFIDQVKAQIRLKDGCYPLVTKDVRTVTVDCYGHMFDYDIPIYTDNEAVPTAQGYTSDEAMFLAVNQDALTKFIVVNDKAKEHPLFEEALKHEMAHLILNHKPSLRYSLSKKYRLYVESEADKVAVQLLGANPNALIAILEEFGYKDKWVNKQRIEKLKDMLI